MLACRFFPLFFLCHEANALHGSDWKLTQKGLAHVTPIVAGMSKVRIPVRAEKLPMQLISCKIEVAKSQQGLGRYFVTYGFLTPTLQRNCCFLHTCPALPEEEKTMPSSNPAPQGSIQNLLKIWSILAPQNLLTIYSKSPPIQISNIQNDHFLQNTGNPASQDLYSKSPRHHLNSASIIFRYVFFGELDAISKTCKLNIEEYHLLICRKRLTVEMLTFLLQPSHFPVLLVAALIEDCP